MLSLFANMNSVQILGFYNMITDFLTEKLGEGCLRMMIRLTKTRKIGCIYTCMFDGSGSLIKRYRLKTNHWRASDEYTPKRSVVKYYLHILLQRMPAFARKHFCEAVQQIEEECKDHTFLSLKDTEITNIVFKVPNSMARVLNLHLQYMDSDQNSDIMYALLNVKPPVQ